MASKLSVVFVNADASAEAYQGLADTYAAIEPPTWSLLLAQSCRAAGYSCAIIDAPAERLTHEQVVSRLVEFDPRLVCFVVYGQNPNSGTVNMAANTECCALLKEASPNAVTCFVGSHTSALPREVLAHDFVDVVLLNEGVYALRNLLASDLGDDLRKIAGIGHKRDGQPVLNPPERVVPTELMDVDLPGYAWDLLPYERRPLDLYRAHFWHANYDHERRSPFAAIYTSLGCRFKCDFCMINIVNRVDNSDEVDASHSPNMRFWSPEFMVAELAKLAEMGVERVRISDEMLFLDRRHYEPMLSGIIEAELGLKMWGYSRIDTVRERHLGLFRDAGFEWLAVGVEAGSREVRREVSKGTFKLEDVTDVAELIRSAGISVAANYIFGFPHDTPETMGQTRDLALELCTEMANMYPCQALPGSPLYWEARRNGWKLPDTYAGYGFLSYDAEPLPTHRVSAAEVLRFRDQAWLDYHRDERFLNLVEKRFGGTQRSNIEAMTDVRLRRKLLGD